MIPPSGLWTKIHHMQFRMINGERQGFNKNVPKECFLLVIVLMLVYEMVEQTFLSASR